MNTRTPHEPYQIAIARRFTDSFSSVSHLILRSSFHLGILILFLSPSLPVKSGGFQKLIDLVQSSDSPESLPGESDESAEVMAEMIRNYEIDLSSVANNLSLNECITLALQNNPDIARQYNLYQGLLWDSISTRREWLPLLTLDAPIGYRNKTTEIYSFNRSSPITSRSFDLQNGSNLKPELKLTWSLLNLSRMSLLQSQKEDVFSQGLRLRQDVRELILNVQSDYYDLQRARQEEDVYNGIYEFSLKLLSKSDPKSLSQDGEKTISALKARSLQALSLRVSAQQNVVRLSASLAARLALPPDSFVLPADRLAAQGKWEQRLHQSVSTALERREEIKIANSQAKAFKERADSLSRKYIPEISAEASGKVENDDFRLSSTTKSNSNINTYSLDKFVGIRVKWTIFDSGVLAAQSSSLRKKELASQKKGALDRLAIESQVKSAYSVYASQLIQLPVVKRELDQSLVSLELRTNQANDSSVSSLTSLIQAIDQYQSAASRWFATLQKYNEAIAQLYRYTSQWPVGVNSQVANNLKYLDGINMQIR